MDKNIRKELIQASKLYRKREYVQSLEIFQRNYQNSPEEFSPEQRGLYAWAIYQVHVKNFTDGEELFEAVEEIFDIVPQADLSKAKTCPIALSTMKVIDELYAEEDYYGLIYWAERVNPDFLASQRGKFHGRVTRSMKERYFDKVTKAYLECEEYEKCINLSKKALESLKRFTNNSDTWYRWRIAKSLKELKRHEEALKYLKEVVEVKNDWYVHKEFVDNYISLQRDDEARNHVCEAILGKGPSNYKVNLYSQIYHLLKDSEPEIAMRHAELYYLLKIDTQAFMDEEIEDLDIDETQLDQKELEREIHDYWRQFKFKNRQLQYGTVTQFFDDKNYGFITTENDESIFFHKNEFDGDAVFIGQMVSFYTEKSFDKSKNEESIKAVNVKAE